MESQCLKSGSIYKRESGWFFRPWVNKVLKLYSDYTISVIEEKEEGKDVVIRYKLVDKDAQIISLWNQPKQNSFTISVQKFDSKASKISSKIQEIFLATATTKDRDEWINTIKKLFDKLKIESSTKEEDDEEEDISLIESSISDSNNISEGGKFMPTYKWQLIQPWHEPLPWSGLEIKLSMNTGKKLARISNPMQAVMLILCLDRPVRVYVDRSDTIKTICQKISENWPGDTGRHFVRPNPADLDLMHDSKIIPFFKIAEEISLFFIHKHISVIWKGHEISKPLESLVEISTHHHSSEAEIIEDIETSLVPVNNETATSNNALIIYNESCH